MGYGIVLTTIVLIAIAATIWVVVNWRKPSELDILLRKLAADFDAVATEMEKKVRPAMDEMFAAVTAMEALLDEYDERDNDE